MKGENPVITVDLIFAEVIGMEFHRKFDDENGANQFYPVESTKHSPNKMDK
ncbi:hypothetical protein [Psychrobacillus glaciei]|uniref:hypothetical protein n=1 Tax=Psychrobacillus glaciei TaxID=2283160 RepID=UPI001CEF789B|nr:hypothetical protein [Psychrobacillus glaciei]